MINEYIDFQIILRPLDSEQHTIVVRGPGGDARATITLPLADLQYQVCLSRLRTLDTDETTIIELGQILFSTLFQGRTKDVYTRSRGMLTSTQGLRLQVNIEAYDIAAAAVPWEFLIDPDSGPLVMLDAPIVRYLPQPAKIPSLETRLPLKVLLTGAHTPPILDVERELNEIQNALSQLGQHIQITVESHLTREKLQRLLRKGFHIWHFVGHGSLEEGRSQGELYFENVIGDIEKVSAFQLGVLLNRSQLRLVVLDACNSAGLAMDTFHAVAPALVRAQIPAVIAMQYSIPNESARAFAGEFYRTLAEGFPVDACMIEGRRAVMSITGLGRPDWGIPVIYTRAPDGKLFTILAPTSSITKVTSSSPVIQIEPISTLQGVNTVVRITEDAPRNIASVSKSLPIKFVHSYSLPSVWAHRDNEINQLTSAISSSNNRVLSLVAIGGTGKSAIVRKLIDELNQRGITFEGCLWFSFYVEPDVDRFLVEACRYFIPKFDANEHPSPFSKSSLLREELSQKRCLIILDGFEMMLEDKQNSPRYGSSKDRVIRDFLIGICGISGQSQILITSRWSPTDLVGVKGYMEIILPDLSEEAALQYMIHQGIKGDVEYIRATCVYYGCHALTLKILADWLMQPPTLGDIRAVSNLEQIPVETPQGEKLQSILNGYWEMLTYPEKYFMTRLSAFRAGITGDAFRVMAVLDDGRPYAIQNPVFHQTLRRLRQSALLQIEYHNEKTIYTAHPLVKTYFYDRMSLEERRTVHLALTDYAKGLPVPDRPRTREEIEPLVELFHQCVGAGLWREAAALFKPGNKLGLHLYEWGQFDEQLNMLERLFDEQSIIELSTEPETLSNLWSAAGLVSRKLGKTREANKYFARAVRIDKQSSNLLAEAFHWTMWSYTPAWMGKYKRALAMMNRGIELDAKLGNIKNEPIQRGWRGDYLTALGRINEGLVDLNHSIESARSQYPPNVRHECHSLIRRGDLYLHIGETEKAKLDYEAALLIALTPGRKQSDFEADVIRGIAAYYFALRETDKSIGYCNKALRIASDSGYRYVELAVLTLLMRIAEMVGDIQLIKDNAARALKTADECMYRTFAAQAYIVLCRYYLDCGDRFEFHRNLELLNKIMRLCDHFWTRKEYEALIQMM